MQTGCRSFPIEVVYTEFCSTNITIETQPTNIMWAKEEIKNSMPASNFKQRKQTAVRMRKKEHTEVGKRNRV